MAGPDHDSRELDAIGRDEVEGRATGSAKGAEPTTGTPPAGPHAEPRLTNSDATPGSGSLPSAPSDGEADAGTG